MGSPSSVNIKLAVLELLINTVYVLINAWSIYLISVVKGGAFNRWEVFKKETGVYSNSFLSRQFINSGISTPSIDTSKPP